MSQFQLDALERIDTVGSIAVVYLAVAVCLLTVIAVRSFRS